MAPMARTREMLDFDQEKRLGIIEHITYIIYAIQLLLSLLLASSI